MFMAVLVVLLACGNCLGSVRPLEVVSEVSYQPLGFHYHSSLSSFPPGDSITGDHGLAPTISGLYQSSGKFNVTLVSLDHAALLSSIRWNYSLLCLRDCEKKGLLNFRGFEWTKGTIFDKNICHLGVVNTSWFADPQALGDREKEKKDYEKSRKIKVSFQNEGPEIVTSLEDMYSWLGKNLPENGFWGFAHPWSGTYQFNDFRLCSQFITKLRCCYMEVAGGPNDTPIKEGLPFLFRAIQKGWGCGVAFGEDNPGQVKYTAKSTWGGAVLKKPGYPTRGELEEAILERRLFVSEKVGFTLDWYLTDATTGYTIRMGGIWNLDIHGLPTCYRIVAPTREFEKIDYQLVYLIYRKEIKKYVASNKLGGYDDPMNKIRSDPPLAAVTGLVLKDGSWIIGSPIWFH